VRRFRRRPRAVRSVWTCPPSEWDPEWWHKIGVPYVGGDEWGRRTVVIGLWFLGYVSWAFRTCWCDECHEMREQTYRLLREGESTAGTVAT
jgi:hypothetical protein